MLLLSCVCARFRNGRELVPLGELHSWDYGFQGNSPIGSEGRTLLPGDILTLQCTFDSRGRPNWTHSGPGTRDEMCFHVSCWLAGSTWGYHSAADVDWLSSSCLYSGAAVGCTAGQQSLRATSPPGTLLFDAATHSGM